MRKLLVFSAFCFFLTFACKKDLSIIIPNPILKKDSVICWKCITTAQEPGIGETPITMEYCNITDAEIKILERDIILEQVSPNGQGFTAKVYKTKCQLFNKAGK